MFDEEDRCVHDPPMPVRRQAGVPWERQPAIAAVSPAANDTRVAARLARDMTRPGGMTELAVASGPKPHAIGVRLLPGSRDVDPGVSAGRYNIVRRTAGIISKALKNCRNAGQKTTRRLAIGRLSAGSRCLSCLLRWIYGALPSSKGWNGP